MWGIFKFVLAFFLVFSAGCQSRIVGQIELLGVRPSDGTLYRFGAADVPIPARRTSVLPSNGDPVRVTQDVITIQVDAAYVRSLPPRLTGSKDIVLFAEIQEDAAAGYAGNKLTSIVYVGKNQRIPGRLNFNGNLVYGPVAFKGHPLKIKFTLMVLQSAAANQEQSAINVIANLASAAAPQYASITSTVAATVRDLLLAQPDIVAFDYEATFLSDHPGVAVVQNENDMTDAPWLRYGRFVLLETLGFGDRAKSLWDQMQPGDIVFDGASLRQKAGNASLPANYLVFSIVPGQVSEQDATLVAASEQSAKLLASLSSPDTQADAAVTDIVNQSRDILTEFVRSRAGSIASDAARSAEASVATTQPADRETQVVPLFQHRFEQQWQVLLSRLPAGNPGASSLKAIHDEVMENWLALYGGEAVGP